MNISELNAKYQNCKCVKEHKCPIDFVVIENGAINKLGWYDKDDSAGF